VDLEILKQLKQALLDYDEDAAARLAEEWVAGGGNPVEAMAALTEAIQIVGYGFGCGDLFLPDLVGAATAMEAAVGPLQEAVRQSGMKRESLGIVVLGTVAGDIHTIGKSMVGALLSAAGFEVHDIGIDVSTEKFVRSILEREATVLAMSALLTSTAKEMKNVIDALVEAGLRDRVKVMVGGGALTADYARGIGADGYSPSATGAVDVARELVGLSA
jgi:methylmalonyl-CoA mutase cobalamin-binding domain/chain